MSHCIPWAKPALLGNELERVTRALESTWISGGPFVDELESRVAQLCESPHALAVANGTAAIHLAYLGIDLQPGDEVIVPGFGFLAAANVALHMHAVPVFAEVDPDSWCVTAKAIEPCISARTRAIVPIHTYGNVCAMDDICTLAAERGIAVIEDVAEAFACRYQGRAAGSIGTLGCFSFQATKTITTGEGGLVLSRDETLNQRMASFRSHGMLRKRYWHDVPGHNFRLTNLQAAIGCAQLDQLDSIIAQRRHVHQVYRNLLEGQDGIRLQHFADDVDPVLWAMACRLNPRSFPQGRDAVMEQLSRVGIETRPGFYPASVQEIYACGPLPICEMISSEMISLPTFPTLSDEEIEYVCRQLLALRVKREAPVQVAAC